uniref:Uncharacterized protein n=1 Tax=Anguilla anguilla TaxID=7936 RepID=A0A0E9XQU9_ANGAN
MKNGEMRTFLTSCSLLSLMEFLFSAFWFY